MRKTAAVLLLTLASVSGHASVIYTDATSFNSAISGATTEDFESYPVSGTSGGGASTSLTFSDFSVSTSPDAAKLLDSAFLFSQNTTPGGTKYLYLDTDMGNVGSLSTFTFDTAVTNVGFYYSYNPDWDSQSNLDLTIGTNTYTLGPVDSTSGIGFWGITNDISFTSFQIDSGIISGYGIDDVSYGGGSTSVPEPAPLALLGLGLAGLGLYRRKKTA
jgi:hypothetical protein